MKSILIIHKDDYAKTKKDVLKRKKSYRIRDNLLEFNTNINSLSYIFVIENYETWKLFLHDMFVARSSNSFLAIIRFPRSVT